MATPAIVRGGLIIRIKAFDLPKQEKKLVIDTAGIVRLGELIAEEYLEK